MTAAREKVRPVVGRLSRDNANPHDASQTSDPENGRALKYKV